MHLLHFTAVSDLAGAHPHPEKSFGPSCASGGGSYTPQGADLPLQMGLLVIPPNFASGSQMPFLTLALLNSHTFSFA